MDKQLQSNKKSPKIAPTLEAVPKALPRRPRIRLPSSCACAQIRQIRGYQRNSVALGWRIVARIRQGNPYLPLISRETDVSTRLQAHGGAFGCAHSNTAHFHEAACHPRRAPKVHMNV